MINKSIFKEKLYHHKIKKKILDSLMDAAFSTFSVGQYTVRSTKKIAEGGLFSWLFCID